MNLQMRLANHYCSQGSERSCSGCRGDASDFRRKSKGCRYTSLPTAKPDATDPSPSPRASRSGRCRTGAIGPAPAASWACCGRRAGFKRPGMPSWWTQGLYIPRLSPEVHPTALLSVRRLREGRAHFGSKSRVTMVTSEGPFVSAAERVPVRVRSDTADAGWRDLRRTTWGLAKNYPAGSVKSDPSDGVECPICRLSEQWPGHARDDSLGHFRQSPNALRLDHRP